MENWFINQMKEAETNKRQISEKTGIAYQRIHKIANNPELLKTTGYENVQKIARALHMTIEQINARLKEEKTEKPEDLIENYLNEITDYRYPEKAEFVAGCIRPVDMFGIGAERVDMWEEVGHDPAKYVDMYLNQKASFFEYSRISKFFDHVDHKHWYRVRAMFDEVIKTDSDAGSVLLMKEDGSSVKISNNYGDGTTRIGVVEYGDENFDGNMMDYSGISLTGEWYIMKYDCERKFSEEMVAAKITGDFGVYAYEGIVAFVLYE